MPTFNKLNQPAYAVVTNFTRLDDNSLQVKYSIGIGKETGKELTEFEPLITDYIYLDGTIADEVLNAPLTSADIGLSPLDLQLKRIYEKLIDLERVKI